MLLCGIVYKSRSLADPGKAGGCLRTPLSLIHSFSEPFPPTALWRRHAQMVRDSSFYVIGIKTFLNLEGHHNRITGSKVTANLLKGWILSIGGASALEGLRSKGLPRLVIISHILVKTYCHSFMSKII